MTALLEVEGVSKAFGGVQALSECCLEVPEGSISGLIGPNGSGKTTLFNVMTGFERVTEGEVRLRGHQIVNSRPDRIFRQGIGRTFQLTRIFSRLTVMENMLVATQRQAQSVRNLVARAGSTVERRRAWELLEFVGITRLAEELAGNLSYGQRKLLELAYVLIADPAVILLDEPAGGVNPSLITHIADRIRELNRGGKTFLVVEHNMELVMSLCDRVTVMHQGRSILSGPPEIVRSDSRVLDAYLGTVLDDEEASPMMAPAVPRTHEINGTGAPGTALGTGPSGDPEQGPLLVLDGVVAGYGGGDVLHGVSCTVPATGITCIVGPNGAGKSTLLATISGVLRPRLGEISFRGESLVGKNPREVLDRGIVQVPQNRSLFPEMTVRENVELGGFRLRDKALLRQRLEAVEDLFPIVAQRAKDRAGSLSGGQQRMVEFARCLMLDPTLVVLDEPSMGLDPKSAKLVFETVQRVNRQGRTILMVEQNAKAGLRMSTDGVVLENGMVRLFGTGQEVLEHPEIGALYLGGTLGETSTR